MLGMSQPLLGTFSIHLSEVIEGRKKNIEKFKKERQAVVPRAQTFKPREFNL